MGFYRDRIVPSVIDLVMRNEQATSRRAVLVPQATGRVLEVGIGSGLNLPFYSRDVTRLVAIEPSAKLAAMTRAKAPRVAFPIDLLERSAEEIPLDDRSMDTVVVTWVLCSIPDPLRALREMRRVLAPGGRMLFVEHGLAPDAGVRGWQQRLNPIWSRISGGCNMNRGIEDLVRAAGFRIATLDRFYLKGLPLLSATYEGTAYPS
jgi:ubiquinone/menaquinone biosynthesis C-methylase UbiE